MMNNKKVINELNKKNEYLENRVSVLKSANKDLLKDIEKKELKICELNTKLCRAEGQLNKLDNYIRTTTGTSILGNK